MQSRKVQDSRTEITRVLRYQHLNQQRRLFGGALMQWIDELGGIAAARHASKAVTTAAIDSLEFREPAHLEDLLMMDARVTYVGTTSIEVKVNTYVQRLDNPENKKINQAYVVYVALDDEGQPTPVPALELEDDEERREWEAGKKRYDLRKRRRREKF